MKVIELVTKKKEIADSLETLKPQETYSTLHSSLVAKVSFYPRKQLFCLSSLSLDSAVPTPKSPNDNEGFGRFSQAGRTESVDSTQLCALYY